MAKTLSVSNGLALSRYIGFSRLRPLGAPQLPISHAASVSRTRPLLRTAYFLAITKIARL